VNLRARNDRADGATAARRWTTRVLLAFVACALPRGALAHGGAYNPGGSVPTGPSAPSVPGPATGMPGPAGLPGGGPTGATAGRSSWEDWWHFNKDPYLELKRAVGSGLPTTAADELLAGKTASALPTPDVLRSRVAPALRALIETEKSPEIVGAALVALARISGPGDAGSHGTTDPAATRALVSRLADLNQEIAETAVLSLGIAQAEDALPILEALLAGDARGRELVGNREVSIRTRAFAAYGLGLVGVRAKNNRTRQIVARALCAVLQEGGTGAAPSSNAPNSDVEVAAIIGLSLDRVDPVRNPGSSAPWVSLQSELRFVRAVIDDGRRPAVVRAHAVTALARFSRDGIDPARIAPEEVRTEAEESFLAALRARSKLENAPLQSVAQALGLLGTAGTDAVDRKIRTALAQVLEDPDLQARCFALVALAEIGSRNCNAEGDDEGATACRNVITGELVRGRGITRPWAAIALGVLERRIVDAHAKGATPGKQSTLAGHGDGLAPPIERSEELLRSYFASAKQRTHIGAAAIALGLCRDKKSVPMLLERLGDISEDQGQGYVALALGMIGDEQAATVLHDVVKASKYKPDLLEQASVALALLGDKSAAPELTELLGKAQGQTAQASLAQALGKIGDVRTIEPLLKLIERKDLTSSARAFAAAALGQVADTDLMPWYSPISVDLNYVASTGTLLAGDGSGLLEIL